MNELIARRRFIEKAVTIALVLFGQSPSEGREEGGMFNRFTVYHYLKKLFDRWALLMIF